LKFLVTYITSYNEVISRKKERERERERDVFGEGILIQNSIYCEFFRYVTAREAAGQMSTEDFLCEDRDFARYCWTWTVINTSATTAKLPSNYRQTVVGSNTCRFA